MIRVGGEIDAFCSRCQLVLAHTVHAVVAGRAVRIECNTCHAVHAGRDGGRPAPRPRPAAERRSAPTATLEALRAAGGVPGRPYSPRETYARGDVLDHPVFGRGLVSALRDGGKIEVAFRSAIRVLVHGRS